MMSHPSAAALLLGNRYQLVEPLGAGAMGAIYRAQDRLTGQHVALKRVIAASEAYSSDDLRLALMREFRMLASLHHPHIISVLDYGFDSARQPYYTMSLIEGAGDVVSYARRQPLETQLALISQLLQALAYLHRRGVLHRDLKPMNVLVDQAGTVRVVDFGLAVITDSSTKSLDDLTAGTLAYMAPELFKGDRVSQQADLYAVGVMAYEIFAGTHPFNARNVGALITDVLHKTPDLSPLPAPIREWVGVLLSKSRAERTALGGAADLNRRLFQAFSLPSPVDALAVRESFLQSAAFVGRETEMTALSTALNDALRGSGSAWLIGGESGVGKSRLVSELRTLAQVSGALVATAQAVTEIGTPYQFWGAVLRRLCLNVDTAHITDLAAGALKAVIPDLETLLQRDTAPLNRVNPDPEAADTRLLDSVTDLFRRLPGATVLILEDLQWAGAESIALLAGIARIVPDLPILIVATYRDDEAPDMPDALPDMRTIRLGRLDKHGIVELSTSILGAAGRTPTVIEFLERETEGNAFFVVEVIRALGEEAGDLDQIGQSALPESVSAGGIRRIVSRRLERLPASARPLLELAAVIGRQIDPAIVQRAAQHALPGADVAAWLSACAEAAVLEVQDGEWRFAHDKLREGVLNQLSSSAKARLHRAAAAALEWCYGESGQPDDGSALLAYHWGAADDEERERHYLALAADRARERGAYHQAQAFGERALWLTQKRRAALPPDEADAAIAPEWLARLNACLGWAYSGLGDYATSRRYFDAQLAIQRGRDDRAGIADALSNLAATAWRTGNYQEAWQFASDSEMIYRALGDSVGIAWSLDTLSRVARWLGDNEIARRYALEALSLHTEMENQVGISEAHNNLGLVAQMLGEFTAALRHFQESLAISRRIGTTDRNLHQTLNNLGIVAAAVGQYAEAKAYFEQSLALAEANRNQRMIANLLSNLGNIALQTHQYAEAQTRLEASLHVANQIGHKRIIAWTLANLGALALQLGVYPEAEARYQESLVVGQGLNERWLIANAIYGLGEVARVTENVGLAAAKYQEALELLIEIKARPTILSVLVSLARLRASIGQIDSAARLIGLVQAHPALNAEGRAAAETAAVEIGAALDDVRYAALAQEGAALLNAPGFNAVIAHIIQRMATDERPVYP
ncbi:MAG: BREX system ATP-binding domain-containing protein [bacterium]|nr:BREX system ATP-binding domain-containing protein [bacterium]